MKTFNLNQECMNHFHQDALAPQEIKDIRDTIFKENDPCEIDLNEKPYAVVLPWSDYENLLSELEYLDSVARYGEG